MLNLQLLEEYADVRAARLGKEGEAKDLKVHEDALLEAALEHMAQEGVKSAIDPKGRKLSIRTDTYLSAIDGDEEAVNTVLEALGLSDMIKTQANKRTLAAWYREVERDEGPDDPRLHALEQVCNVNRVPRIGVTNG